MSTFFAVVFAAAAARSAYISAREIARVYRSARVAIAARRLRRVAIARLSEYADDFNDCEYAFSRRPEFVQEFLSPRAIARRTH